MTEQQAAQQKLVPAVERAALILDLVAAAKRYPTVSELARETALPKSTVHGLCTTLVQLGLLVRRPDQTYLLGPHLLRWSHAFERQTDVATEFAALWDQTEIDIDSIASLCIPDDTDIVFIAARQVPAFRSFPVRAGMRLPAAFSAAGKAIVACWPDYEIFRAFSGGLPEKLTDRSVASLEELLAEIQEIRTRGVAVEAGQCQADITSFAGAVLDSINRPVAAVMLSVESDKLTDENRQRLEATVSSFALRLSHRLGADVAA
ncbi:MAG: IclR family transcriptional regulator [Rhizobiaceae bacterium]|nr:IclR family transcriptional regulator [Rhizobiaceae bacterium]